MKKSLGVLIILVGIALSILWIIRDPGWNALFNHSVIFIGFLPLPGQLLGFVIQLIPASLGVAFGGKLMSEG